MNTALLTTLATVVITVGVSMLVAALIKALHFITRRMIGGHHKEKRS